VTYLSGNPFVHIENGFRFAGPATGAPDSINPQIPARGAKAPAGLALSRDGRWKAAPFDLKL
jgi:hypothetical protein